MDEDGGLMPPFFPLHGCYGCVSGAAYSKRRYGKAKEGAEAYRGQLEEQKKEMFRQDRELFQAVYLGLESTGVESLRSLATVLMVRTDKLELHTRSGNSWRTGAMRAWRRPRLRRS